MTTKVTKKTVFNSYKSLAVLVFGIIAGIVVGLIFGEKATVLQPFGDIFLNLMFTAVVPLVFFSLSSTVAKMTNLKRLGKIMQNSLVVFMITGVIASIFIITVVTIFPPAAGVHIDIATFEQPEKLSLLEQFSKAITVSDFNLILSRRAMLPLIIFAIMFGYSVSHVTRTRNLEHNVVTEFLELSAEAFMKMINIIMLYAPIGLGAYFASLVGTYGQDLVGAYSKAVLMFFPICIVYFLIGFTSYAYYAGGIKGVKIYYKNILPAVITSIATQSSIATLPTTLECTRKMNVPEDIRNFVVPLGATVHMDGAALTTLMKIAFLFGIFNMNFTGINIWVTATVISVLTGVVLSGIPGGGMMGSLIIVGFYGFNPDVIPIIVTIGMLTDAIATMINVTGDAVAAMMVTKRVEGKDWLGKDFNGEVAFVEGI